MTKIVVTPRAEADLDAIVDHYLAEAGVEVAASFLTAWTRVLAHLSDHPASGSNRLADRAKMAGLRVWPMKGFPHLAIYVHQGETVMINRILHSARDIPPTLRE
jgi:toxin ParE1/3/4